MIALEPKANRPRSARLPRALDDMFTAEAKRTGRQFAEVWIEATIRGLSAPASPATSPTISDGDRLRAAMAKGGWSSDRLARTLGYAHRSAVADVLRKSGPRPLQGRLLAWVEGVEAGGARK